MKEIEAGKGSEGSCTREDVYEDAKRKTSPFHVDLFSKSADDVIREWRLERAGYMLRSLEVIPADVRLIGEAAKEIAPAMVYIPAREGFVSWSKTVDDEDLRRSWLDSIIVDLEEVRAKLIRNKKLYAMLDDVIAEAKKERT